MTSPATPPDPNASKLLRGGRYTLIGKLGEGSQGETYEAMDHGIGPEARKRAARAAPLVDKWARYVREQRSGGEVPQDAKLVAIKCFRVGTAKAWKDVELAEREARTLASLDHPRLPRYFEHFEEDGALYLVMEKIEGESLAALRKRGPAMSVAEVTRMLEDIADALRYLHGRAPPVVHRDIKPGNIIRRPDGSFALVDFGAVRDRLKPAGGSTVVGTFGYMAPEQFQGRASPASDVYGLGATALTMLTGTEPEELPHKGLGIDVARALPKGTPASLARALEAMLVPDPDRRLASVDAALAILRDERPHGDEDEDEERSARAREPAPRLNRKQQRALAKQQEKQRALAKREQKKQRRASARRRRPPLLPRMLGRLGPVRRDARGVGHRRVRRCPSCSFSCRSSSAQRCAEPRRHAWTRRREVRRRSAARRCGCRDIATTGALLATRTPRGSASRRDRRACAQRSRRTSRHRRRTPTRGWKSASKRRRSESACACMRGLRRNATRSAAGRSEIAHAQELRVRTVNRLPPAR